MSSLPPVAPVSIPVTGQSLRRRLLWLLLGGCAAFALLLGVVAWLLTHHEIDELYDEQLRQLASSLLLVSHHQVAPQMAAAPLTNPQGLEKPRFLFQIRNSKGELLAHSPGRGITPLTVHDGFSEIEDAHGHWRYYSQWDASQQYQVQIGEDHQWRDRLIRENLLKLLPPLLLLMPLLGFWLWHATNRGLQPLELLARKIEALRLSDFPVSTTDSLAARWQPEAPVPQEAVPLVTAIHQLLQQVEQALHLERRFTADAAHELRTPLAALRTQLQVAQRARDAAERDHALNHLQQGLGRTARLVEQMLLLARLDPERGLPDAAVVDLSSLAESVCAELGPTALEKQQELSLEAPAGLRLQGQADWLHSLLRNLLENAIRYTPAGGQIVVALAQTPAIQEITLSVRDSGPGIPPSERQKVLQRFYRLNQSGDNSAGSGLGLSIVARIAQLHGASVVLATGPLGGLRVTVCFSASLAKVDTC